MNYLEEIILLLREKKALFADYEKSTNAIFDAQEDTTNNYITKRDDLAIEIDNISAKIVEFFENTSDDKLKAACGCKGNYSDYSGEYVAVYDEAKEIYACISRISEKNDEIEESFKARQAVLKERIAATNNTPKIKKYLGALTNTGGDSFFIGNDKKA